MAILLCSVAAVGLAAMTGVFLLYIPLMPAVVVFVILLGIAAAFALGIHGGLWLAEHRADDFEESSLEAEVGVTPRSVVKRAELSTT